MNLNDLHNLMDRLARTSDPGDADLEAREGELRAALDAHPEWAAEMRTRDAFDVRLCKVMPQVDVPEGLKERLLAAVDEEQFETQPAPEFDRARRSRRRAVALFAASIAMCFAAVWMFLNTLAPDLTVAEIENVLPELWDALEAGDLDAEPAQAVLPSGPWNRLRFREDWKTHPESDQPLAFRTFEFVSAHGRTHTGLLASLPLSSFPSANLPTSADPFSGEIRYLRKSDGSMLAIVSWTDAHTERVYFLAAPAADQTLEALKELMYVEAV